MRISIRILFLIGIVIFTAFSCEDEPKLELQLVEIPFSKVHGLSACQDSCFLRDANFKDEFLVINNHQNMIHILNVILITI